MRAVLFTLAVLLAGPALALEAGKPLVATTDARVRQTGYPDGPVVGILPKGTLVVPFWCQQNICKISQPLFGFIRAADFKPTTLERPKCISLDPKKCN